MSLANPIDITPNANSFRKEWITILTVMLVAIMEVLDSTIVNVALPRMMGSLNANTVQIAWILTAYVVSAAIFIPLTGFFESLIGRKNLLLTSITGFLVSSLICGMSTDLTTIVVMRILQGAFGASFIPLSQAILNETFPREERTKAMAIWGIGIMTAPVFGPAIGAYVTEYWSWRWVFYINVPICITCFFLVLWKIKDTTHHLQRIDWTGLLLMSFGIACLQLMLDQGNEYDWFASENILLLAIISGACLILFIARGILKKNTTGKNPNIIDFTIFKDRNFNVATLIVSTYVATLWASLIMQPLMLQRLMGYPILTTGLTMIPRGIASAICMAIVPPLVQRFSIRWIVGAGLFCAAYGNYLMSLYSLDAGIMDIIWPTLYQGLSIGLIFPALSAYALLSVAPQHNTEAAGLFSYGRMLGGSIGLSVFGTLLTNIAQANWYTLSAHITPFNTLLQPSATTLQQYAQLLHQQASMIAFIDIYRLCSWITTLLIPLVCLLKTRDVLQKKAD